MEEIIVAFAKDSSRQKVNRLLEARGYTASWLCASGAETIRAVQPQGGAVVVCSFRLRDMTAETLACRLGEQASLLVLAPAAELALCEGENICKLALPVNRSDFYAALELLLRRSPPKRSGGDRALIDRAKALLTDVHQMTEAEAHRFLQRYSMDRGMKLAEAAAVILEAYS